MSTRTVSEPRRIDWGRYALVGIATIVAAVVANLVVYFVAGLIVRYDPGFDPLSTPGGTIIFTLVPAIVAVLLYAVLLRVTADPARIFTWIAIVVLIVSWIPDLTIVPGTPGSSTGQIIVLMLMHAVAALVIVWTLTTYSKTAIR